MADAVKKETKMGIKAFISLIPLHQYYKNHYLRKYKGEVKKESEWRAVLKKDGMIGK